MAKPTDLREAVARRVVALEAQPDLSGDDEAAVDPRPNILAKAVRCEARA